MVQGVAAQPSDSDHPQEREVKAEKKLKIVDLSIVIEKVARGPPVRGRRNFAYSEAGDAGITLEVVYPAFADFITGLPVPVQVDIFSMIAGLLPRPGEYLNVLFPLEEDGKTGKAYVINMTSVEVGVKLFALIDY